MKLISAFAAMMMSLSHLIQCQVSRKITEAKVALIFKVLLLDCSVVLRRAVWLVAVSKAFGMAYLLV